MMLLQPAPLVQTIRLRRKAPCGKNATANRCLVRPDVPVFTSVDHPRFRCHRPDSLDRVPLDGCRVEAHIQLDLAGFIGTVDRIDLDPGETFASSPSVLFL